MTTLFIKKNALMLNVKNNYNKKYFFSNAILTAFNMKRLIYWFEPIFLKIAKDQKKIFHIEISVKIASYYIGDELRIQCILMLFLECAFKYTREDDSILLSVELKKTKDDVDEICFVVRNNGVGVEINLIPKNFELHRKGIEKEISGLELMIAHHYAEILGGKIDVLSDMEFGSIFTLYLSLKKSNNTKKDNRIKH